MADGGKPLAGKVALVAGATRGAGRGIAVALGAAGATVWCSGRTAQGQVGMPGRPETIEQTVEMVTAAGGQGIGARCDHTVETDVEGLVARIEAESGGLDILINDVWGGDDLVDWCKPFWEADMKTAWALIERAIFSHMITARYATPLLLKSDRGLIVEITDGETAGYRGHLLYDLVKSSVIRLAYGMAWDLKATNVTSIAVSPGYLRSEDMLRHFGVTEETWRDGMKTDPFWEQSETPTFVGRAIAALAADPNIRARSGGAYLATHLAHDYGFTDVDGRQPAFWISIEKMIEDRVAAGGPVEKDEAGIGAARYGHIHLDHRRSDQARLYQERYRMGDLPAGLRPV
ncbi:MAG: SDR family oxidoreductase [Caulobacteraceae bacterium]